MKTNKFKIVKSDNKDFNFMIVQGENKICYIKHYYINELALANMICDALNESKKSLKLEI